MPPQMRGWEQGPHNFLLHYAEDALRYLPIKDDARANPTIILAEEMVKRMRVVIAAAEDPWLCTIGYFHNIHIEQKKDAEGYILAQNTANGPQRCALIHQLDRYPWIWEHMDRMFPLRG